MRRAYLKKSLITGIISTIVLLSMFPVVSSVSTDPATETEVAEGGIYCSNMLSPIPSITKPKEGCWYFYDTEILSGMPTTRIIGPITITVKVVDPTGYGVDRVEFKIDDDLKATDNTPTVDEDGNYWFEWLCDDELPWGEHEIEVVAFDNFSNWQSRSITVLKGLVLNSVEYNACLEACEALQAAGLEIIGSEMSGYYCLNVCENGNLVSY